MAVDSLDFALSATNYGLDVSVLFEGDGVYQLLDNQSPVKGLKNIRKKVAVLSLFDIEKQFVCTTSLATRHLDVVNDELIPVDTAQKLELFNTTDFVVRL